MPRFPWQVSKEQLEELKKLQEEGSLPQDGWHFTF